MSDLWPFIRLFARHKWPMLFGVLLAIITLIASIGLLTLSGWFLAASASAGLVIATRGQFNYLYPSAGVRGFSLLRTVARWAERVVSHDATFRILTLLRGRFFEALLPLPAKDRQSLRSGDLLNRMVSDVDTLDHIYLRLISPLIAAVVAIAGCVLFLSWFDIELALVLGAVLVGLLLTLPMLFYKLGKRPGEKLGDATQSLRQDLNDTLSAHTELSVYGAMDEQRHKVAESEQQLLDAQKRLNGLTALSQFLLQLLNGWTLVLMLYLGADQIGALAPPGPLLALVGFLTLASFEAIIPVAGAFQHLSHTLSAARRLNPILNHAPTQTFGDQPWTEGVLRMEALNFSYPGAINPALSDCQLELHPGEKIAIVGKTGCGKSTLLQLISREWQPNSGRITLADTPLNTISEASLRANLCVIEQKVHIFNATLADNLRIAATGASEAELVTVLSRVGLDHLLETKGLSLWLGDGGRPLSGGEARRIGLARALLHPGKWLLMDEPTEGLDNDTEQKVLDELLDSDRSVIYVTHKQAGLERMDRVLTMHQGQFG
ncbi:heme ABC transporter ATP-binding protein/permease CydC [Ferrimonas aestuarii]|uniref:Cysteine/glutathione ABC transporter ATP-binding protein/permease CydC n=1 Tax=Ferrimonas aestuarii TaxID=2569539 RepID=A0A4U1BN17_9GAMM|nr:cysteine/glutathione ABC transporter ATP-binding protein/permease CydC [Ferrimonas aestuarii]TKB53259.1 cysteine/glutathione ABC transporter ATP-binding protein/permease CydC [Ferrimonas aestuarii]